ncbi:MAG: hypothetical protein WC050_03250 [Candidatus Paceibacterota bacterium]
MNPQTKTTTLLALLIVLVIVAGLLLSLSNIAKQQRLLSVGSFSDCALAGYPIMESFPEQCRTPDGRTFVNEKQQAPPEATSTGITANGCAVGGCSAQLCGEAGDEMMSTCEYRPEYGCYQKHSSCERQANGRCGWTPTPALAQCLAHPPAIDANVEAVY